MTYNNDITTKLIAWQTSPTDVFKLTNFINKNSSVIISYNTCTIFAFLDLKGGTNNASLKLRKFLLFFNSCVFI